MKYPIGQYNRESIRSKTGKSPDDITLENVMSGNITAEDIKISPEVLKLQSRVAEEAGKKQMAENLIRASELVNIPDEVILRMYNMLRPKRATKEELQRMAAALENEYGAKSCAALVLDALYVYEKRGILL